jgi:hypothetical protein
MDALDIGSVPQLRAGVPYRAATLPAMSVEFSLILTICRSVCKGYAR